MRLGLSVALMVVAPGVLRAQSGNGDLRAIVDRVVANVANVAEQSYVFPDTGKLVADHVRNRHREGAYATITDPAQLADRLTNDMRAINGDRHLYVTFAGTRPPQSGPQPQMVMRRPGDPILPDALAAARRANYDVESVQRLAGNVGYLSVTRLSTRGTDEAFAVIDAAMAFLERTDAMIIDLRNTTGGDPRLSDYLASYFFGPTPTPTLTSYSRRMDRTDERTTVPVTGKLRPAVPLFLLVGLGTASGTEDFAFIMKQTGRGTLVGGQTAGAGRLTGLYPLGDGFTASVSGGRTYDPRTGKEWERTGIAPDIASSNDDALTVAHAAAVQKLADAASDPAYKGALAWTRAVLLARARPVVIAPSVLRTLAGTYDTREVRLENGALWHDRDGVRLPERLVAVNDSTFAVGEATRVEFVRDGGRVTAVKFVSPLGLVSTFPRTK
jgi:retinol-binding protein 3